MKTQQALDINIKTPSEIYQELDKYVIGQERAKRVMAVAAYNHLKRLSRKIDGKPSILRKSNVLLVGPTGVGKTHLARIMAKVLDLPFVVVDATEYTEAGYYGKDVEVMIAELLHAVNLNPETAEKGIIFVDEIDKIARRSGGMRTGAGSRDIGGEGVQQALLKLLEGRKLFVPYNVTQHWNKHDFVEIDTTNILFICAGTFTDIRGYTENGSIGFSEEPQLTREKRKHISYKQLLEYGLLSELLGRLPVVSQLDALMPNDLVKIMTEPPDSVIKEYTELLAMDEIKLDISRQSIKTIAEFAFSRKIGARGLKSIMEEVMHDIMFDAPANRGKAVKVTPKYVKQKLESFDSGMLEE